MAPLEQSHIIGVLAHTSMEFLRKLHHRAVELVDTTQPQPKKYASSHGHGEGKAKFAKCIQDMGQLPLEREMEDTLTTLAQQKSLEFLKDHSSLLPKSGISKKPNYAFVGEKQATVRVYESMHLNRYHVKGVTTIPGSVYDVLSALQLHGEAFNTTMSEIFGLYYDDGMTLHTPSDRSSSAITASTEDISDLDGVGLHWMVLKTSRAMGQEGERDLVVTSYSQMYETDADEDDDGLSVSLTATRKNSPLVTCGTHIWESIELPQLQAFPPSVTGRRRLALRNSGIYCEKARTPTHADLTSITLVLSFEMAENFDHRCYANWMKRLILSVQNISRMARQGARAIVPRDKWSLSTSCSLCSSTFNLIRRRHHCRLCGLTVCHSCSCSMDVEFPILTDGRIVPHRTVRSCTKCAFIGSTMQRGGPGAAALLGAGEIEHFTRGQCVPSTMWASNLTPIPRRRFRSGNSKISSGAWRDSSDETFATDNLTPHARTPIQRASTPNIVSGISLKGTIQTRRCQTPQGTSRHQNITIATPQRRSHTSKSSTSRLLSYWEDDHVESKLYQFSNAPTAVQLPLEFPSLSTRGMQARRQELLEQASAMSPDVILSSDLSSTEPINYQRYDQVAML